MRRITFIITHLLLPIFLITTFSCTSVHDRAISDLTKAIENNPRDAESYYNRGITYAVGKGQYDKAISDYNKALEINPRDAETYTVRGIAYGAKGLHDQAISDFNRALEINPGFALAYNNRAVSYYLKREYDKAWEDVNKAQGLGFQVHPEFLDALRQASGRQR